MINFLASFIMCTSILSFLLESKQVFPSEIFDSSFVLNNITNARSSSQEVFYKKSVLRNLQNSQENICARDSFLIKLQALGLCRPLVAASPVLYS